MKHHCFQVKLLCFPLYCVMFSFYSKNPPHLLSDAILCKDCVLDRYQDQVTLTRSNWYERLCCRVPESNTRVFSLSNIVGVQALGTQGLSFVLTSGISTPVTTKAVEYRWVLFRYLYGIMSSHSEWLVTELSYG